MVKSDFQKFMKRLRKEVGDEKIRFFHCGEYGDGGGRPHYHALVFGFDFDDKKVWQTKGDRTLYRSETLERLWPHGHSVIGEVTFESASYVSSYVTKKVTGEAAAAHYGRRLPEYVTMSRRPGIGRAWIERWKGDVYPSDEVIVRGFQSKPPRYYDNVVGESDPVLIENVKKAREEEGLTRLTRLVDNCMKDVKFTELESHPVRWRQKEKVREAKFKMKKRDLEATP